MPHEGVGQSDGDLRKPGTTPTAHSDVGCLAGDVALGYCWHVEQTKVDNTVKEGKNNTVLKALSFALLQRGLEFTALMMSRVGHTHNSLGALAEAR